MSVACHRSCAKLTWNLSLPIGTNFEGCTEELNFSSNASTVLIPRLHQRLGGAESMTQSQVIHMLAVAGSCLSFKMAVYSWCLIDIVLVVRE